ncbi:MAG: 30S ribosomal protein S2 [Candidatus Omnitrophica bacterium]|nr:30S ribosomal protein S2 [Candidatus Omnitrophota bacterium]
MTTELVRQLLEAGVHFGHQTKRWNPKMKPFIFGSRSGIYILDLEKTEQCLKTACDFLEDIAASGQKVLFVGTKKQARSILAAEAERAKMPFVVTRWLGGTLTNFQTIRANIEKLRRLRLQKESGFFERISKKDAKNLQRQLDGLEERFSGLAEVDQVPGCLFVVDTKREEIAVREAQRVQIPIVAICDTNTDPDLITYPIPGNDDAIRSVKLMVSIAVERIIAGRRRFELQNQSAELAKAASEAGEDSSDASVASSEEAAPSTIASERKDATQ